MTLDALLARLHGVKRSGANWIARCPAHADRQPSLSVARAANGRVLLHCFAGCPFRSIVRAVLGEAPA